MSIVNRNSHKIKTYTKTIEQTSLANTKKNLTSLKRYLDVFALDVEDPNLSDLITEVNESINSSLKSVQQLEEVNSRLGKESDDLIAVSEDTDFITIKTEPVETALREALINVDNFYNFANNYTSYISRGISDKIIRGALVEFRTKVNQKLNELIRQRQQLIESSNDGEDGQDNSQQIAQLNAQIDHLKRCLEAADTYEKRLYQINSDLAQIENAAKKNTELIRKIHSHASNKIAEIKKAVNN